MMLISSMVTVAAPAVTVSTRSEGIGAGVGRLNTPSIHPPAATPVTSVHVDEKLVDAEEIANAADEPAPASHALTLYLVLGCAIGPP